MLTTTPVDAEVLALIDFLETDLLSPTLQRRLNLFPPDDLKMALRDVIDWLSLRGILRGRSALPTSYVHPLTGRILARLPGLSQYLCVPNHHLAFRLEVPLPTREELEDFVMHRIWHRPWSNKRKTPATPVESATEAKELTSNDELVIR
jgi:hypothetical protein